MSYLNVKTYHLMLVLIRGLSLKLSQNKTEQITTV